MSHLVPCKDYINQLNTWKPWSHFFLVVCTPFLDFLEETGEKVVLKRASRQANLERTQITPQD